jgi:hypothetical protein
MRNAKGVIRCVDAANGDELLRCAGCNMVRYCMRVTPTYLI